MTAAFALALWMAAQQPAPSFGQDVQRAIGEVAAKPEPIDVPAIRESVSFNEKDGDLTELIRKHCDGRHLSYDVEQHAYGEWACLFPPTCADKSRILMRSEDNHYWCHKPQP